MQNTGNVGLKMLSRPMRWMLYLASFLVLAVGLQLFVFTSYLDDFFKWAVNPPLTALFIGGAYGSSFLLEFLCARARVWAMARIAVPAVLTFTTLTLIVSLLNRDSVYIDSDNLFSLGWIAVYLLVPPSMLILLLLQLRRPGGDPLRTHPLASWFRGVIAFQAAVMLLIGFALFLFPGGAAVFWPWDLTTMTAQVIGVWLIGLGIAAAQATWENDWPRIWPMTFSSLAFTALQIIAVLRSPSCVHWESPAAWFYLIFLFSVFAAAVYGIIVSRGDFSFLSGKARQRSESELRP